MALSQLDLQTVGSSVVVALPEQVSSELAGEAIVLNLKAGVYYGLNEVGTRIWNLVQQPQTIATIRDNLLAEYDVEPEVCERDLLQLLQELETAGLIEIQNQIG